MEFKELLNAKVRNHRREKETAEGPYEYTLQIFFSKDLSYKNVVNSTKTLWSLYPGLKKEGNISWILGLKDKIQAVRKDLGILGLMKIEASINISTKDGRIVHFKDFNKFEEKAGKAISDFHRLHPNKTIDIRVYYRAFETPPEPEIEETVRA